MLINQTTNANLLIFSYFSVLRVFKTPLAWRSLNHFAFIHYQWPCRYVANNNLDLCEMNYPHAISSEVLVDVESGGSDGFCER